MKAVWAGLVLTEDDGSDGSFGVVEILLGYGVVVMRAEVTIEVVVAFASHRLVGWVGFSVNVRWTACDPLVDQVSCNYDVCESDCELLKLGLVQRGSGQPNLQVGCVAFQPIAEGP